MKAHLFIRLGNTPQQQVAWVYQTKEKTFESTAYGSLHEAAKHTQFAKVIVLVPAVSIYLTSVKIPARSRKQLLNALPYALEDEIASNVEDLHFAAGKKQEDKCLPAAGVNKETLEKWLQVLHDANIQPDIMMPETLLLNKNTLLIEDEQAIFCDGLNKGFGMDTINLSALLKIYCESFENQNKDEPFKLCVLDYRQIKDKRLIDELRSFNIIKDDNLPNSLEPLDYMVQNFDTNKSINLLQGAYSSRGTLNLLWHSWKTAVVLAAILICVHMSTAGLRYYRWTKEISLLDEKIKQIYLKAFPEAKQVVNARIQMEQKLYALQTKEQNNFLTQLAKVGTQVAKMKTNLIKKIDYIQGRLTIDIISSLPEHIEAILQRLKEKRVDAEILSISNENGKTYGRLVIKNN
mmetsp:Transcript_6286/g.3530  ORF Transcript_6286/g.3530 Transcript_6286/m.3530 type:complete len:406 (-) Transcript_6286:1923-3140(-)